MFSDNTHCNLEGVGEKQRKTEIAKERGLLGPLFSIGAHSIKVGEVIT